MFYRINDIYNFLHKVAIILQISSDNSRQLFELHDLSQNYVETSWLDLIDQHLQFFHLERIKWADQLIKSFGT